MCLSSTETEYIASTGAAEEAIWLRQLVCDLKQDVPQLTSLLMDNLGAQLLAYIMYINF